MMSIKQKLLKQQNSMRIYLKDLMNTDTAKELGIILEKEKYGILWKQRLFNGNFWKSR